MNIGEALAGARRALRDSNIEEASLEGEVLLRYVLELDRAQFFTSLKKKISRTRLAALEAALKRRRAGEPTAYITGHREFFGLDFSVDKHVLIPRPESELLVERAIALVKKRKYTSIADIGTGSGAIAISLAVHLPDVAIYATDISPQALQTAIRNARQHDVSDRIVFLQGDLVAPLPCAVDLIIANLPYVRAADLAAPGPLTFEPALALAGGEDGLDLIGVFCSRAAAKVQKMGGLLLEVGAGQAERVVALLLKQFPAAAIAIYPDLAGIDRVISLCI